MERAMEQLNRLTRSLRRARTVELPEGEAPRGRALRRRGAGGGGPRGRGPGRLLAGGGSERKWPRAGAGCGGAPRTGAAADSQCLPELPVGRRGGIHSFIYF